MNAATGAALVLTLDRGNSTLDCRLRGDGVHVRSRVDASPDGLAAFLGDRRPTRAAGVSVVPDGLAAVRELLARLGIELAEAGVELACPLELAYPAPDTLGRDRWVGAFAAHRRFGQAIVVDCGTAVTVGLVTRDGRFLGGAIAPGAGSMAAGLAARAPVLPAVDLGRGDPHELPSCSSAEAVRAGIEIGFAGLVDRLVERARSAAELGDATLIATGGEAGILLRHSELAFVELPELVHEGLEHLL